MRDHQLRKVLLIWTLILMLAGILFLSSPRALGYTIKLKTPEDNHSCFVCHAQHPGSEAKAKAPHVDDEEYGLTAHGNLTCTECHEGVAEIPHPRRVLDVNCGKCHSLQVSIDRDPKSTHYSYYESIHAKARLRGERAAATCTSCHGTHNIYAVSDKKSRTQRGNIPTTCGSCHKKVLATYLGSIHGKAWKSGVNDSAVCTDCHGEHDIKSPRDLESHVSSAHVADTCSRCHSNDKIMKKYGVPVTQAETYKESFHGVANKLGYKVAANCRSCHGYHDILPSSDMASSINPKNLPRTCGQCHDNPTQNVASGKTHVLISKEDNMLLFVVANGFKWLTIGTMLSLVGHISLDLYNRSRRKGKLHP